MKASTDPLKLAGLLWPNMRLYRQQRLILESVWENDETYVFAGNKLGKDYIAALIVLLVFLTRHPCRILTTSVDGSQLAAVLWGEIRRLIEGSAYPLTHDRGGPLIVNHLLIRKVYNGTMCGLSYIMGRVAAKGEGLQGHHVSPDDLERANDGIFRTLAVGDESSALDDADYRMLSTWAARKLFIGNPWRCNNFFRRAELDGDRRRLKGAGYARRVLRIAAEDSPNVIYGRMEEAAGREPSDRIVVPGVKPYFEYLQNRRDWDEEQQCVCLDAKFYEGKGAMLFPADALARSAAIAESLRGQLRRALAVGIDTGEGSSDTVYTAGDELGIVEQVSTLTPDTSVIRAETIAFGLRNGVPPEMWCFDRGGGGYEHANYLRADGYSVQTVAFGEGVAPPPHLGVTPVEGRVQQHEERTAYANRRSQMYGEAAELVRRGYGIPAELKELRRQLSLIPLTRDKEGKLKLLSKKELRTGDPSLEKIIGCSPDEADSFVVMVHTMLHSEPVVAGAI